jgi:hypothetical protein
MRERASEMARIRDQAETHRQERDEADARRIEAESALVRLRRDTPIRGRTVLLTRGELPLRPHRDVRVVYALLGAFAGLLASLALRLSIRG